MSKISNCCFIFQLNRNIDCPELILNLNYLVPSCQNKQKYVLCVILSY